MEGAPSAWRPDGSALILVVGARRSGTHWLQRIVAAHPDVSALPGETYFFASAIAPLVARFTSGTPATTTIGSFFAEREVLVKSLRTFCDAVLAPHLAGGTTRLLERTPDHVRHIPLIAELYPEARFIHIIRDGRDSIRSLVHQSFGPDDVRVAATEWRDSVTAGRRDAASARHLLEVRYEQLRQDTDVEVRALFRFLGLSAEDDAVRAAIEESRVVRNQRSGTPQPLGRRDQRRVRAIAGELLAELGYDDNDTTAPITTSGSSSEGAPATTAGSQGENAPPRNRTLRPSDRQHLVDQFLSAIRHPAVTTADVAPLLSRQIRFEVLRPGREEHATFDVQEFLNAVAEDTALGAPVRHASLHSGADLIVAVHVHDGGETRIIGARFDNEGISQVRLEHVPR